MDEELYDKIQDYLPSESVDFVANAYGFAESAHAGQLRLSGEEFFEHPKQTAIFLAGLRLDANALAAALLHDVLEDCDVTYSQLEREFGEDVARLVDGVTKLTRAEDAGDIEATTVTGEKPTMDGIASADDIAQAETIRKMLMAMSEDVRVVLIKLADRLHNMRTVSALPLKRREGMSRETLDIYAPLAHRLGIWEIKWILEDLAFQQLDPKAYRRISRTLNAKRVEREAYIARVIRLLVDELDEAGIESDVTGRPKHIYSIHKKSERYANNNKEVSEIYDLFALRITVKEVKDCYAALGVVHAKWHPLPGQFDDYIANPKDNLYQSIHTAVLCEDSAPVEIQIRTGEMHEVAEYGIAAHWVYKEGGGRDLKFEEKMAWIRQLMEWQRDVVGSVEFVESFKTDIFRDQVYVYTPNGEVKELPSGATPLDFAYRIHTDVGHACVGAKVNGKLVALNSELSNGDSVHIMTSKTGAPSLDWLNASIGYTKTSSARAKIRQWFNRQERQTNIERGDEIYHSQLKRLDLNLSEDAAAGLLNFNSSDDMLAAIGDGSLTTEKLIQRLSVEESSDQMVLTEIPRTGPASGIEVLGVGDLLTNIARCCNPIMGDEIIGFITRGRGVTVHRKNCRNIMEEDEKQRIVPVDWGESKSLYPVRIQIDGWDRVGLLGDITSVVSERRINIANIASEEYDDMSVVSLTVYVSGINQLNGLHAKLEAIQGVIEVSRSRNLKS